MASGPSGTHREVVETTAYDVVEALYQASLEATARWSSETLKCIRIEPADQRKAVEEAKRTADLLASVLKRAETKGRPS